MRWVELLHWDQCGNPFLCAGEYMYICYFFKIE